MIHGTEDGKGEIYRREMLLSNKQERKTNDDVLLITVDSVNIDM